MIVIRKFRNYSQAEFIISILIFSLFVLVIQLSIWLSKFFPNLAYSENILLNIKNVEYSILFYAIMVLLFGLMFWLSRKFAGVKRFILVFAAGFIGMTLEIILILLYQNKNGILYRDIGMLLMMFMVGSVTWIIYCK